MPSLIIGMGMSMSLAMLAHVCRAVYVVSGIFNPVISGQSENSVASNKPMHTVLLI